MTSPHIVDFCIVPSTFLKTNIFLYLLFFALISIFVITFVHFAVIVMQFELPFFLICSIVNYLPTIE